MAAAVLVRMREYACRDRCCKSEGDQERDRVACSHRPPTIREQSTRSRSVERRVNEPNCQWGRTSRMVG